MGTTTRRKTSKYTPEQLEEFRARDAAIDQAADDTLADTDRMADIACQLVQVSGSIRRLSLRNQAMLFRQAEERGVTVTDVRTYRQWREIGRGVRKGSKSFKIVRPRGTETASSDPANAVEPAAGDTAEQGETTRTRFRMMSVFDVADTEGWDVEDETEIPELTTLSGTPAAPPAQTAEQRAAAVWDRLAEQVTNAGYTVDVVERIDDLDKAGRVDHDAQVITIERHDNPAATAAALGVQLAAVLTFKREQRRAAKARTESAPVEPVAPEPAAEGNERVILDLGEAYGPATFDVRTEWKTGRTAYKIVTGSRISGTFTIYPQGRREDGLNLPEVHVELGDTTDGHWYSDYRYPADTPVVNGIKVLGGRISDMNRVTQDGYGGHYWINARRLRGEYSRSERVPDATCHRAGAVARAITLHWATREDLDEVRMAAFTWSAANKRAEAARRAEIVEKKLAELQQEQAELNDQMDLFTV